MQKEKFTVTGMTCAACSAHVEKAVKQVPGVCSVNVNLLGGSMVVEHDGDCADPFESFHSSFAYLKRNFVR